MAIAAAGSPTATSAVLTKHERDAVGGGEGREVGDGAAAERTAAIEVARRNASMLAAGVDEWRRCAASRSSTRDKPGVAQAWIPHDSLHDRLQQQRVEDPDTDRNVVEVRGVERPADRGAQVVELDREPGPPHQFVAAQQPGADLLGERGVVGGVAAPQPVEITGAVPGEMTQGLEQLVAGRGPSRSAPIIDFATRLASASITSHRSIASPAHTATAASSSKLDGNTPSRSNTVRSVSSSSE